MKTRFSRPVPLLTAALLLVACGGGDGSPGTDGADAGPASGNAAAAQAAELPVSEPTGPVDQALADRGAQLFKSRGCVSCHTVGGGRRVGPDLEDVTERRDFEWTYHMITNPDSMVRNDSIAKALLSEYFTPMSDQNVKPDQFRAIYEYLRSESGGAGPS